MKHFLTVFTIVFLCCILAITAGFVVYSKMNPQDSQAIAPVGDENPSGDGSGQPDGGEKKEEETPLEKAYKEKDRVNFLLLGMEGPRSDTIIFASFDRDNKKVDMISIPRDTYYLRQGEQYQVADERKINAVYADNGVRAVENAVSEILQGVPIHHYVKVDYRGVEKIVDSLGGVEVDVPMDMKYEDPYDDPPLIIDIPKGRQVLDGENAVKFLRFRSGYKEGDLGRVKAQQQFLKSAAKRALSFKIVPVIKTAINYVKTDVSIPKALLYGNDAIKVNLGEDLNMQTLAGHAEKRTYQGVKLSYFIYDKEKVKELMMELYGVEEEKVAE